MNSKRTAKHRLWWLPLLALLLLAVAAVAVFLVGSRGVSADADDPRTILSAYDPGSFSGVTLREDGTLELSLEKTDLYWFAGEYGLTQPVRDWLRSDAALDSAGFRMGGGALTISVSRRAGGILPLSYRAEAELSLRDTALCLEVRRVRLGARIPLRESQWPALFRQPLSVDLSGTDFASELLSAELTGSALCLRLAGLTRPPEGSLSADPGRAAALRMFGLDTDAVLPIGEDGSVTVAELFRCAVESGDARRYLSEAMSLCAAEDLPVLWEGAGSIPRQWLWEPLLTEAERCRQNRESVLAERQSAYEKLLLAVREMYRSGALGIQETGFYNPATGEAVHPGTLSRLDVTAIDSRIVFLTTASAEAAPEEMPEMLAVPRKNWLTTDEDLDWKADVDLGVLLTTEGEVPILLYRRGDGTLVLREVTEELYVSAMVSRPIPQIDLDSLPAVREYARGAGEGFTGAAMGFLE